jgi:hypothetical protein
VPDHRRRWAQCCGDHPAALYHDGTGFTFHGVRHSFVAILVAAGCTVREVSAWAGGLTA